MFMILHFLHDASAKPLQLAAFWAGGGVALAASMWVGQVLGLVLANEL